MDNKAKIAKNISWLLFEHGVRMASGIVVAFVLARVLGVERYGVFQYILALVVIFKSFSYINPAEIMVPCLVSATGIERKNLMGNGFTIRFCASIFAFIIFLLFVYFKDGVEIFYLALVLGISILLDEAFGIVTAFFTISDNDKISKRDIYCFINNKNGCVIDDVFLRCKKYLSLCIGLFM